MNKTLSFVLILVVIGLGGYFLFKSPEVQAPITETGSSNTSTSIDQNVVTYGESGYTPNTITIKAGTTVTFRNDSSLSMWTASAFHPTHGVYPTKGGCLGSTFDACKGVLPGESWSFKFDKVGTWKYHDHLKPTFFGTVVVEY